MRALYSVAMRLAQPLLRRKLLRRAQAEPRYGQHIAQRFGDYAGVASAAEGGYVWVHAVSLGETRAAAALVAQLRLTLPGMRLLLTHGTATGWEQGQALLQDDDVQVWQPWDTPAAVGKFLRHFRPRVGLLMETEVWPTMVALCARAGVPLCLVNARMSEKSLRQSLRLAWLARPAYSGLHAVWAQSEEDAQRLRQLGASVNGVMGNFKFDASPDAAQLAQGRAWHAASTRPVLMFASVREGEEAMLLECLAHQKPPLDVQWLIVPRHPQRFEEVAALFTAAGLRVSRRSRWQDQPLEADVWLGDSLGEMALYYGLADVALLGGSFAPLGGQNLIEAAACACTVVMGPHTYNFAQAADTAAGVGAAFATASLQEALATAYRLLASPQELERARTAAIQWSQAHKGAAQRTALAVSALLAEKPGSR